MRAASPPGRRHGFDECVSAVSCLNDVFTRVGAAHTTYVHGLWGVDIFVQRDENHHMDMFGRKRLLMLRWNWIQSTAQWGFAKDAMVFQGLLINIHVFIFKVFIEFLLCVWPYPGSWGHNCEEEKQIPFLLSGSLLVMVERDVSQIIRQLNVKLLLYEVPTINRFIMLWVLSRRCEKNKERKKEMWPIL